MRFNSPKQFCMSLWKVGWALHSLKGILSHSYKPMLPNVKAVYCLDSSSVGTCQNPELRSKVEQWAAPARLSRVLQMRGKGWESFTVRALSLLKSMQKRSDLSFFLTKTTALYQGLLLGQTTPASNINFKCSLTSSTWGGGILWNHSLNGGVSGSLRTILCLVALV